MAFTVLEKQDVTQEKLESIVQELAKSKNKAIVYTEKNNQKGILEFSPQNIAQQTRKNGGISLDLTSDTNPTTGYAVACHPELGTWIEADADNQTTLELIKQFVTRNSKILMCDGNVLGTWLSDDPATKGMISLDVSLITPDREEALNLGLIHNQQAIFCLDDFTEIACGGTGYSGRPVMESECTEDYMPNPMQPKEPSKSTFNF